MCERVDNLCQLVTSDVRGGYLIETLRNKSFPNMRPNQRAREDLANPDLKKGFRLGFAWRIRTFWLQIRANTYLIQVALCNRPIDREKGKTGSIANPGSGFLELKMHPNKGCRRRFHPLNPDV